MYSITTSSSESRSSPTALPTSSWVKTKRWTGVASACSSQTYQSLPLGRSAALVIEESYFNSSYLSSRLMSAHFQRPSDGSSKRSQVGTTLLSRLPGDPQTPRRAPRRTNGAFVSCWPWPVPPPHGLRTIGGHVVPVAGASTLRHQTPGSATGAPPPTGTSGRVENPRRTSTVTTETPSMLRRSNPSLLKRRCRSSLRLQSVL